MKIYSIDIRYVDSCKICGNLSVGMTQCTKKGLVVPDNMQIPDWCPLEDAAQPTGQLVHPNLNIGNPVDEKQFCDHDWVDVKGCDSLCRKCLVGMRR